MNTSTEQDDNATTLVFAPGETIFNEGDVAENFFIIASGEVELLIAEKVVGTEREGGIFGEMALISDSTRSAKARAKTECHLDMIDQKGFLSLIRKSPEFALHLMRVMARRIRKHDGL